MGNNYAYSWSRLGGSRPRAPCSTTCRRAMKLFQHKRITTTLTTDAKRLRPVAERRITFSKKATWLLAVACQLRSIADKSVVHELFTVIAPAMVERPGGCTRIIKIGNRRVTTLHGCHRARDGARSIQGRRCRGNQRLLRRSKEAYRARGPQG